MNEWTQRIASHPALARLKSAREAVESTEIRADDILEVSTDLSRIRNVLDALETRFQTIDPVLLFPGPLAALENHLQSVVSEVAAFQTNRNRAHLTNANGQADSLLSVAAQLGIPIAGSTPIESKSLESVRDQAEKLVKSLRTSERTVQQQLNKLNESVIATTTEVTAQKGRLDAAIAEYQQQFSVAESARQQQATEALKTHAQRLDQAIADSQKRLQDTTQDVSKRLDNTLQEVATRAEDQKRGLEANAAEVVSALKEMRGKAENLLHVIGSTGMAGEYQKAANVARRTALVWQGTAGVAMLGLIGFAILVFTATQGETVSWAGVTARAFVALTFGILAAYSARQGDRYSDIELTNRRFQLELSSIDPYLANLPSETQNKLKVELGQRLFGNASVASQNTPKTISGTGKDPLEFALSIIMETIKKR